MLIFGAKGFAKQVFQVIMQLQEDITPVFFDDVNVDDPTVLFNEFRIIKSKNELKNYLLEIDNRVVIGIGGCFQREKFYKLLLSYGGVPVNIISPLAEISSYDTQIGNGVCILTGSIVESSVNVGNGTLINLNCTIAHDVIIGDFCEISPGSNISGGCHLGDRVFIGSNSTILPNISIGNNSIVGAGSVVNKDVPSDSLVYGSPAKFVKKLST